MALVEINNIVKKYKKFTLDDVSLTLEGGKIYGFVGENGSGKSTTMKALTGLINLDSGSVKIFDKDVKKLSLEEKEKIGFTMDEICLPTNLKLTSLNKILKDLFGNWDSNVFEKYLEQFNIDSSKKIKELSKGMKAKLNLAVSLSHNAEVLVLDEPMNGLDPVARDELCDVLINFAYKNKDKTILISSHILSDLEKICTDYIFIHNGKILLQEDKKVLENQFLKLSLPLEDFEKIDKEAVIRFRLTVDKAEVLVVNNEENKKIENALPASPEDILIFLIRGKTL